MHGMTDHISFVLSQIITLSVFASLFNYNDFAFCCKNVHFPALDFTTVTNNARIAVFLAEIFFSLGQDILCKDASGNTIVRHS